MSENELNHWTEDDERLSSYVLGQLNPEEVAGLEEHLRTCSKCRDAVKHERLLASAVRRYGRDELKSRLNAAIAEKAATSGRFITWQRTLSAVAVLVVVAGIGVYNGWFSKGSRDLFVPKGENQRFEEKEERSQGDSSGPERGNKPRTRASESEQTGQKAEKGKPPAEGSRTAGQELAAQLQKEKFTHDDLTAKNVAPSIVSGGGIAQKKDVSAVMSGVGQDQPVTQFWTEGTILRTQLLSQERNRTAKKPALEAQSPDRNVAEAGETRYDHPKQGIPEREEFQVNQTKADELPVERQIVEGTGDSLIQTLVERSRNTVKLTLYLRTLMDERALREARVVRVGPDSVVMQIRSLQIWYRIPQKPIQPIRDQSKKVKE